MDRRAAGAVGGHLRVRPGSPQRRADRPAAAELRRRRLPGVEDAAAGGRGNDARAGALLLLRARGRGVVAGHGAAAGDAGRRHAALAARVGVRPGNVESFLQPPRGAQEIGKQLWN